MMQSKGQREPAGIKRHITVYFAILVLPVTFQLGALTPFVESSWLFAEGGWWRSMTGEEQRAFAVRWSLTWVIGVTAVALFTSMFSSRWREALWKRLGAITLGVGRVIGAIRIWFGFLLVGPRALNRRVDREIQARKERAAKAGPPKGTRSGVPGRVIYGDVFTSQNMYDSTLTVAWRTNNLIIGQLIPASGSMWEVKYGHLDRNQGLFFEETEHLGRVTEIWQGVDLMKQRDLKERDTVSDLHRR